MRPTEARPTLATTRNVSRPRFTRGDAYGHVTSALPATYWAVYSAHLSIATHTECQRAPCESRRRGKRQSVETRERRTRRGDENNARVHSRRGSNANETAASALCTSLTFFAAVDAIFTSLFSRDAGWIRW